MNDTTSIALEYIRRAWAVIQLHDVSSGACSCGSADPVHVRKQGGKHPVWGNWQSEPLTTEQAVRDAWAARPGANVGIVTGQRSGLWVLDVDPDNNGHRELAGLVQAYGMLPETYAVTTGSGGMHYYWLLPDWEPTNSRGRLPVGLDVRGWHGQVVAPPSVSAKGAYRVGCDAPVAHAPAWLLDMIRPVERVEVERGDVSRETWLAPGVDEDRGAAYARVAVGKLLNELANAAPGSRNDTAFRVACRLAELVAADWARLDSDAVFRGYRDACESADDGTFPWAEALSVLNKAIVKVAGAAAELPPPVMLGTVIPFDQLPADVGAFSDAGQGPAIGAVASSPFSAPGAVVAASAVGGDPDEEYIKNEIRRLDIRDKARARVEARNAPPPWGRLTVDDIEALPEPEPVVAGWLFRETLARVNGAAGLGKTFTVLDIAARVAAGFTWMGETVRQTPVVYSLGEGLAGMRGRMGAWRAANPGADLSSFTMIDRAVQVGGPEWAGFTAMCVELKAGLVVLDTQARHTVGREENSNTDMGAVVAALDALRRASKACVLLVHHTGKGGGDEGRGASAVKGALDTEVTMSRATAETVTVRLTRQKDAPDGAVKTLRMVPHAGSVVVRDANAPVGLDGSPFTSPFETDEHIYERRAREIVAVMRSVFAAPAGGTEAAIKVEVKKRIMGDRAADGIKPATIDTQIRRAWNALSNAGRIEPGTGGVGHRAYVEREDLGDIEATPESVEAAERAKLSTPIPVTRRSRKTTE